VRFTGSAKGSYAGVLFTPTQRGLGYDAKNPSRYRLVT
jgi:hypothetical protein